ncbi:hypothetical protein Tco_0286884 [Tanacetum coccineum]
MDADYELAAKLQAEEQDELTIEEKSKLFVELMEKRKKHFVAKRAEEKRSKPLTKAQKRKSMSTYLKNMDGWKLHQLKGKSYDEVEKLFDQAMARINNFVGMDSAEEAKKLEGTSKRAGDEIERKAKMKQKLDNDEELAKLQALIEITPDEEEVVVNAIPLATKPPVIVDYGIYKEGKVGYYKITRADGFDTLYRLKENKISLGSTNLQDAKGKEYALEFAARILNMVPTKKVDKTPYELWHGKSPKFSQEASWGNVGLSVIQDDTQPSENTSEHHDKAKHENVEPSSDIVPIRRSARIPQAPDRYGFYVDDEEHELGDLNEPANYKVV